MSARVSCPIPDNDACLDASPCTLCPHRELPVGGRGGTPRSHPLWCTAAGCEKASASGSALCPMHKARLERHGRLSGRTRLDLFMDKVDRGDADGCWLWTAYVDHGGYGVFRFNGRPNRAHRVAYELFLRPIDLGHHIDHLCHTIDLTCREGTSCRHRRCVNPHHLESVLPVENVRRGKPRLEKCARDHDPTEYSINRRGNGSLFRSCRACRRETAAARRERTAVPA